MRTVAHGGSSQLTAVPASKRALAAPRALLGRDDDLARAEQLLEREPLVTILGPPGVGKTSLAIHLAWRWPGPAVFCDLRARTHGGGLLSAVASLLALALPPDAAEDSHVALIADALAQRGSLLLVLDNFEHLIPWASHISAWLDLAPQLVVLVTSRQRLCLDDEACLPLGPLALDAAVQLLVNRAERVRPGFALNGEDRAILPTIVEELDRLPLAIVLAATRANAMSATEMSVGLKARFELLVASQRASAPGHASLREAIDWSWNALSPSDQGALASCAVFRGGFTASAAERVLGIGRAATVALLATLRDRSLLTVEDPVEGGVPDLRFGLLTSIQEYLADKLDARGARHAVEHDHALFCVEDGERWVARLHGDQARTAIAMLDAEFDNLLAAHRNARDVAPGLAARAALVLASTVAVGGNRNVHRDVYAGAIQAARADGDSALCARALCCAAEVARVTGHFGEIAHQLDEARGLARLAGARDLEGQIERTLGKAQQQAGRLGEARISFEAAYRLHCATGTRELAAAAHASIALLSLLEGRSLEACAIAEEVLDVQRALGDRRQEAIILNLLGETLHHQGRLAEARAHLEHAIPIHRSMGNLLGESIAAGNLAYVLCEQHGFEEAVGHADHALTLFRDQGDRRHLVWMLLALGGIAWGRGDAPQAGRLYYEALEHARVTRSPRLHGAVLYHLGALFGSTDALVDAEAVFTRARSLLQGVGDVEHLAGCEVAMSALDIAHARAAWRVGDRATAATHVAAAERRLALGEVIAPRPPVAPRIAALLLRSAMGASLADLSLVAPVPASAPAPPSTDLRVARDARWFEIGDQPRVELGRRRAARLILLRLVELRGTVPTRGMSLDDVFEIGWPGETIKPHAAALRAYGAVHTLRTLGLRELLQTRDDGYVIDPGARLAIVDV